MSDAAHKTISVLLPTRGRTTALRTSVESLLSRSRSPGSIEILMAFDHDDDVSYQYFLEHTAELFSQYQSHYTCFGFERLGYIKLNQYVNWLAGQAQGQWLMFWGDDAVMETQDWDGHILAVPDFRVLRISTHRQHPYAIFPIVPRAWYDLFGYISAHQLSDSWVSQIAYITDIMHNIDVEVMHDRFDLTGNNQDETWNNRPMLEGNPKDPRDFLHETWRNHRWRDAQRLIDLLRAQGADVTWFDAVRAGTQDPWAKMMSPEYDPNSQLTKFSL